MIITCKNCSTSFSLSDDLIKDTGSKVRCSKCQHVFQVYPPQFQNETEFQKNQTETETIEEKIGHTLPTDYFRDDEKNVSFKPDEDDDFDLFEIDKMLREEEAGLAAELDTYKQGETKEDLENFDFGDLDELFAEDDSSVIDEKPDLPVSSDNLPVEEIDLSELEDFFKDDEESMEVFPGTDTALKESEIEFDSEKISILEPPGPEDIENLSNVEDSEEEIEEIDFSELDNLFGDEDFSSDKFEKDDEQINSEIEIENQDDSKVEAITEKEEGEVDIGFDLDLEMEDDSKVEAITEKEEGESDVDFDLDLEMEDGTNDDSKEVEIAESSEVGHGYELDIEDHQKIDEKTPADGEFDLSDLEDIIDLEEETGNETKSFKTENEEPDFDLALEPDDEKWTSPEVVLDEEGSELDKPQKEAVSDPGHHLKKGALEQDDPFDETVLVASLGEKDDYDPEENQNNYQKVFETVTLTDNAHQDEQVDPDFMEKEERPKNRLGKPVLVLLILFFIAAAGYGAFTLFNAMGIQIPFIGNYMESEVPDSGNLKMIISDLNSKFIENHNVGKIFIITGMVKNEYPEPRSFVKITGKLYQSERRLIHNEQVYAGNVISELELRSLELDAIKSRMQNRLGQNRANVNIQPGQSVPFTIVFSNLTQTPEEFTVEIESSSPA